MIRVHLWFHPFRRPTKRFRGEAPTGGKKPEISQSVDQKDHRSLELLASYATFFARRDSVIASWGYCEGGKPGPYDRLAYRVDGRQYSVNRGRAQHVPSAQNARSQACKCRDKSDLWRDKWAHQDSNLGPRPYQGRALTN